MEIQVFDQMLFDAFAGAEPWADSDPLFAEGQLGDGMNFVLVFDKNGAGFIPQDGQEMYGGYNLPREFASAAEARAFAESLAGFKTIGEFLAAGFGEI